MGTYEKIYLANNLDALDLLVKRNCGSLNIRKLKLQQVCNLLNKLYKESQLNILDQEKTYILLARYLSVYCQFVNTQSDKKFVDLRFGPEYEKVLMQYDEIRRSLKARYASRNVPEKISKPEEKSVPVDEKIRRIFKDEFITCQQLFSALQGKYNVLLVDARPDHDFKDSHLDHPNCINVPDQCITSGLSANALGKKLPEDTQKFWDNRDSYDVIILYDWNTSAEEFALTKLDKLRSALVDWDLNRNYNEKPVVLNGGYLEMLHTYPTLCINPHVYLYQKNDELDELLELDDIEYPIESDNKTHVKGGAEKETPLVNEAETNDDSEVVTKEDLIKENKEITIDRQTVITDLLREEQEWKKINEMFNQETNVSNLHNLKQKEDNVRSEIARLKKTLDELNVKKDDVKRRFELNFQYDPEDEVKSADLKEIIKIEEADSEKLKILNTIAEERCKALEKARALKPKQDDNRGKNNNYEIRETDVPVINRATKPVAHRSPIPRIRVEPLEYMTSGLVGLRNIRNTCYMNTVIQCIRNIPVIMQLFCKGTYARYNVRNPAAIIHETAALIRQLFSTTARYVDPQDFYNKVGTLEPTYKLGNHEDCMEFFLFLLNHLSEDCSHDVTVPNIKTPKQKAWYNQFEGKSSIFFELFYHQVRIRQNCTQCKHKTYKFEIESTFMLSVPERDFNLTELMADYMGDYIIPDYCCAKCKKPVHNQKEICYEPKIIVIVLKRYRQTVINGVLTIKKIESRAHFQRNNFKLGNRLYELNAIAMHSGDVDYGHYTAAALTPKGWYEFSDETVRPISINDDSLRAKACAFFYSMCD